MKHVKNNYRHKIIKNLKKKNHKRNTINENYLKSYSNKL